jgi:hypothetical protein
MSYPIKQMYFMYLLEKVNCKQLTYLQHLTYYTMSPTTHHANTADTAFRPRVNTVLTPQKACTKEPCLFVRTINKLTNSRKGEERRGAGERFSLYEN